MRSGERQPRKLGPPHLKANWLKGSAFLILLAAVILFVTGLAARFNYAQLTSYFFVVVLAALGFALFLVIRYLLLLRNETQDTVMTLVSAGREFKSVFQNVLDGILILDCSGLCLEANPAALAMLRINQDQLLGRTLADFYSDPETFALNWNAFLVEKYQRGSAELVRGDGTPLFVEYTAAADHLPSQHIMFICDVTEKVKAERSLKESENRFQQMANNIQEVFWMLEADTKDIVYVSRAYETITGHTLSEIYSRPSSYKELVHPEDRTRFIAKLEDAALTGRFDEEFRIVRPDGGIRWIWSKGFIVDDSPEAAKRIAGIALDITSRKAAEQETAKHLAAAESARAEADALRKATLTLTKNLRMDELLDVLLQTLHPIVPFDSASVLLLETPDEFLVAREMPLPANRKNLLIIGMNHSRFLQDATLGRKSIFLENTQNEPEWREHAAFGCARSWICIPLVVSENLVGLLSVCSKEPGRFTRDHFKFAKSLALSAAVAIQNARLYESVAIYASELELQLKKLKETQLALEQTQSRSRGS